MSEELARALAHYRLGKAVAVRRIESGFVDDNWLVETERGRYFFKRRHPRRRQPAALVQAQHDLMAHLRRAGLPAPTLVPTSGGETFLALGDDLYELEEFIDGRPYDHGRPSHLDAAARMLGRYHACVEGFTPQAFRERDDLYGPANSRASLARLSDAWQLDRHPELEQVARELAGHADDLAARFDGHGTLPYLVIHGDYYAGNLLFDGDRIVGVVDYDKANWQPRVAEVAEALIYFASPRPGHLKYLVYPGFLEWEPLVRFLLNYARAAILGEDEIQALPDYVWCIWLSVSLRRLLEGAPSCPPEALPALREVLALGAWVNANARRMIEMAREATQAR